jgi:hypothetical protein
MKKAMQVIFCIASMFVLQPTLAAVDSDSGSCVRPNVAQLIGRDIAGAVPVKFYPVADSYGALRWAFASWGGPPDGMAFVIGCNGKSIDSVGIGSLDSVRSGPIVNHRGTVELIVVPGSGTGISVRSVVLLQFDGHRIGKLWEHESEDKWYEPMRTQTETGNISYRWQYSGDGTKIFVNGTDIESSISVRSGKAPVRTKRLHEVFCLKGPTFSQCL